MRRLLVTAALLAAIAFVAVALPPLPTYSQRPCPRGWTWSSFDDSCNILWPKFNRTASNAVGNMPTFLSFKEATAFCKKYNAALPIIVDIATQLTWYMNFAGNHSGRRWWIGVSADPSIKGPPQQWMTATGRKTDFVFSWDTKRAMPGLYDGCVAMDQVGTNATDGKVFGGNGKMITTDCEEHNSVMCTKQRVPVSITGIDGDVPHRIVQVYGFSRTISFYGNRIPNGTLVSLQSMTSNMASLTLPDRAATRCAAVSVLTGVSTPFLLTPNDTVASSQKLCNGTCNVATITIPASWPVIRGANYSFCFYTPLPFATWTSPTEFQFELLGPNAYLQAVQHDKDFLSDICVRRTEDLNAVVGNVGGVENQIATSPYASAAAGAQVFDSPIEGVYDGKLRDHQSTVLHWGR